MSLFPISNRRWNAEVSGNIWISSKPTENWSSVLSHLCFWVRKYWPSYTKKKADIRLAPASFWRKWNLTKQLPFPLETKVQCLGFEFGHLESLCNYMCISVQAQEQEIGGEQRRASKISEKPRPLSISSNAGWVHANSRGEIPVISTSLFIVSLWIGKRTSYKQSQNNWFLIRLQCLWI